MSILCDVRPGPGNLRRVLDAGPWPSDPDAAEPSSAATEPAPGRVLVRQDFHGLLNTGASMALLEPFGALSVLVSEFSVQAR